MPATKPVLTDFVLQQLAGAETRVIGNHLIYVNSFERRKDLPLVVGIVSYSGGGKDTTVAELSEKGYRMVLTHTTRPPKFVGENEYNYVTAEKFLEMEKLGEFAEVNPEFVGHRYGTTKKAIDLITETGEIPILRINPTGAEDWLENDQQRGYQFLYLFLIPESEEVHMKWITDREFSRSNPTEDPTVTTGQRQEKARDEHSMLHPKRAHYAVINREGEMKMMAEEIDRLVKEILGR